MDQVTVLDALTSSAQQPMEAPVATAAPRKKGVMLMNRIGPSGARLYVANSDGSNERELLAASVFEYHAQISPGGEWITFTSEREGDGQADVYRCRLDGSGMEPVVATPSVEDALALSPDGKRATYVSTAEGYKANVWLLELETGKSAT